MTKQDLIELNDAEMIDLGAASEKTLGNKGELTEGEDESSS